MLSAIHCRLNVWDDKKLLIIESEHTHKKSRHGYIDISNVKLRNSRTDLNLFKNSLRSLSY